MEVSRAAIRGIRESLSTVQGSLLRLEVVVLLSAFILAVLVLYGSANRRSSDKLLRGTMWMAYSLSYVVVSYAVGIIQDGPFRGETFVLWAAALLLIQASAYSAPVHSRRDVDQRKKLLLQHVLQTGLVLWLIINATGRNASYRAAIWAFWSLNVLKTAAKIAEMINASRPDMSVKVVAEYMAVEEDLNSDDERPPDPATMEGYRYIFHGEDVMEPVVHDGGRPARDNMLSQTAAKSVVTIDQVYHWIDQQPYSDFEKDRAKDFCLAFALFKLLKRRFYGYVPAEAGSDKARDLVLTGLIHAGATGPDAAFRVVEAELAFLYDFFYTRNIVLVGAKTYIFIAVVVAGLTMWTAFFGTLGPGYHRPHIGVRNLDRSVTMLVVVITAGLEVFQAVVGFSSNWRYVKTVYRCVRDDRPWSSKRRQIHLWWKESITPPEARYWEDKVGEYVLLKRFHHRPWNLLSWLTLYLVEPRRQGQKRGRRKPLPQEVKRAVLLSLKRSHCRLSNGVATLRKHHLLPRLAWACMLPKLTDQILTWHVVTTCCDWDYYSERPAGRAAASDEHHRLTATKLSNYCAYLVAFVPEMLPDPSYNAEQIFDSAVQQARDHLDGCATASSVLHRLGEIEAAERAFVQEGGGTYERAGSATVIERAAVLWGQLRAAVTGDARRWEVLAEFWTELLLFLAPSDNVDIHAEMLGAGGEFMTQIWVLLSHAGVLERPLVMHRL
ncbi:hypothetical protein HU200_026808 [Digitaria exilis]|uniref:DUF4220 domain-containing protein n=1 Tax=Digitaria exilis TaxID=1010633 RepID=A0A835EVA3_9POAL|nr:hypothetical protein HU200_026808 [Digitaria exilis]